jgi:hypothetical protein
VIAHEEEKSLGKPRHRQWDDDLVACLLKARIVKPAEIVVVRERLCKHARC